MEKKFKILVIDDDERIRELLQQFLNKNGFITSIASSTFEAREKMQKAQEELENAEIEGVAQGDARTCLRSGKSVRRLLRPIYALKARMIQLRTHRRVRSRPLLRRL